MNTQKSELLAVRISNPELSDAPPATISLDAFRKFLASRYQNKKKFRKFVMKTLHSDLPIVLSKNNVPTFFVEPVF